MAKRYYEIVEVASGEVVDFIIMDSKENVDVGENYELRRVMKADNLNGVLERWYNIYRNEVVSIERIGSVCVDSGMLMITDPCYVKEATSEKCATIYEATNNEDNSGSILNGLGLAFQTGYGDGIYDVYAKRDENGRIVKVEIILE